MQEFILILLLAVTGTLNVVCFFIGAKIGQKVSKGEDLITPTINPMEIHRKHQAKKESEAEQKRVDTILRNLERYDGTGSGQEDVEGG